MATLYDDISLGYHACGGSKVGKLYSFKPTDGSGDFTCVRATTPNRINENGDIEVVPVNTPVIDWSTGSPLLIVTVEGELTLTTPTNATKIVITIDGEDVEYNNIFPTLSLPVGSITKVIATVGGTEYDLLRDYLLRVDTASGTIDEQGARDLKSMYEFLDDEGLLGGLELLYLSNAGMVQRTDGVLKYVRTAFDASDNDNDLDGSSTASKQPRLVGGIAPWSKPAASNQNGEARYFTHPAISYGATDAWSVTVAVDWNGSLITQAQDLFGNTISHGRFEINRGSDYHMFKFTNSLNANNYELKSNSSIIGKNSIISVVAAGDGILKIYVNGSLFSTVSIATSITINSFIRGFFNDTARAGNLKASAYHLQSGAMSAAQVLAEYNLLSAMYPEIETVTIDSQVWASRNFEAVATPMGNVIANVTDNATWANATVLYNAAYAATSGTTAQKEYAGYKAAAMWCYYNNDPANGAIYGKLYNWYAAKLLDLDMASAGFGYHVPTSAEFTTLATALGGASVAGGKMKMTGTDYWNTPNTGATNESGFTALGGGRRTDAGVFGTLNVLGVFASVTSIDSNNTNNTIMQSADAVVSIEQILSKLRGVSLRLIKNS